MLNLKCSICQSSNVKVAFRRVFDFYFKTPHNGPIFECLDCGVLFNELGDVHASEYKNYYTSESAKFVERKVSSFYEFLPFVREINDFATNIGPYFNIESGLKILDYGCGSGKFGDYLADSFCADVFLYDEFETVNTKVCKVITERDELTSLRFDVIFIHHVIEHTNNPIELLSFLNGMLAENGTLIISTPNSRSMSRYIFRRYWRGLEFPRHRYIFSVGSLALCADRADLDVQHIITTCRSSRDMAFVSAASLIIGPGSFYGLRVFGYLYQVLHFYYSKFFGGVCGEEIFMYAKKKAI